MRWSNPSNNTNDNASRQPPSISKSWFPQILDHDLALNNIPTSSSLFQSSSPTDAFPKFNVVQTSQSSKILNYNMSPSLDKRISLLSAKSIPSCPDLSNDQINLQFSSIPERALLHDLLNPLQGIDGTYIKYDSEYQNYAIIEDLRAMTALPVQIALSRVAIIGVLYGYLTNLLESEKCNYTNNLSRDRGPVVEFPPSSEAVAKTSYDRLCTSKRVAQLFEPDKLPHGPSLIRDALTNFIQLKLTEYHKLLVILEADIQDTTSTRVGVEPSFRSLGIWLQESYEMLSYLTALCEVTLTLSGGALLSVAYDNALRGDQAGSLFNDELLGFLVEPWLEQVRKWTEEAILVDPYEEFFVYTIATTNDTGHVSEHKPSIEKLWKHTYSLDLTMLPVFIPEFIAHKVFTCGKATALIEQFKEFHNRSTYADCGPNNLSKGGRRLNLCESIYHPNYISTHKDDAPKLRSFSFSGYSLLQEKARTTFVEPAMDNRSECNMTHDCINIYDANPKIIERNDVKLYANLPGLEEVIAMQNRLCYLEYQRCQRALHLFIYENQGLKHCSALKNFFFLGQGDLITELLNLFKHKMSEEKYTTRCNLALDAQQISVHQIRSCLQSAIASSNAQYYSPDIQSKFDIQKLDNVMSTKNALTGWESICFDYITEDSPVQLLLNPTTMKSYKSIHALLWKLERIYYHLTRVWSNHIRLFSKSRPDKKVVYSPSEQWALQRCNCLCSEMTHFLRNMQSFLIYDVIESAWFDFNQFIRKLVAADYESVREIHPQQSSKSLVDQLIDSHERYLGIMLYQSFLVDDYIVLDASSQMPNFILMDHSLDYENDDAEDENKPPCESASRREHRRIALDLLLDILQCILDYIELANNIFPIMVRNRGKELHQRANGLTFKTSVETLDKLDRLYVKKTFSFLQHLDLLVKSKGDSLQPLLGRAGQTSTYTEALRSLICRLDFNNYYKSDYGSFSAESMRRPPLVSDPSPQQQAEPQSSQSESDENSVSSENSHTETDSYSTYTESSSDGKD